MDTSNGIQTTMPVAPAGYGGGLNGFGGDGNGWWIILFFLIVLGGAWGGNGWGGNGGNMPGYSQVNDFSTLERENDIIRSDICSGFAGVNQTLANGFQGIQTSFANAELSRSNTQAALMNQMYQSSLADVQGRCETNANISSGFAGVNYNLATQGCDTRNTIQNTTRDVIDSQRDGTNAILSALNAQRIEAKDAQIAELQNRVNMLALQSSQVTQNAYLLQTLRPYPVPAFTVVPPGTTTDGAARTSAVSAG